MNLNRVSVLYAKLRTRKRAVSLSLFSFLYKESRIKDSETPMNTYQKYLFILKILITVACFDSELCHPQAVKDFTKKKYTYMYHNSKFLSQYCHTFLFIA